MPNANFAYPKEMYLETSYRVVHSPEEEEACSKKGWTEVKDEGVQYRPITARDPSKKKLSPKDESK